MARRISFTKAEVSAVVEVLARVVDERETGNEFMTMPRQKAGAVEKALASLLAKMESAQLPMEKKPYLTVAGLCVELARAGVKAIWPANADDGFWRKLDAVMATYGLTVAQGAEVAQAAKRWRQPVALDTVVYRVSTLLAESSRADGKVAGNERTDTGWTGRRDFTPE